MQKVKMNETKSKEAKETFYSMLLKRLT